MDKVNEELFGKVWIGDDKGGWVDFETLFVSREEFVILKEKIRELEQTVSPMDKKKLEILHLETMKALCFMYGALEGLKKTPKGVDRVIDWINDQFLEMRGLKATLDV